MPTKEHRLDARRLIENLELRVHTGPAIPDAEILSANEFLRQRDFSPASDYFARLDQIRNRLLVRRQEPACLSGKRNYGGEAAGRWMQVQFAYDHVIISSCYEGDFRCKHGRVKLSHRVNEWGRIDFVELKFLTSLHSCLNGELRKLIMVKNYATLRKPWNTAEAFFLPVLPRELLFLFEDIFKFPQNEILAWLVNMGHRLIEDLLGDLRARCPVSHGSRNSGKIGQMCLDALCSDEVAWRILERSAPFECRVELSGSDTALVHYPGSLS